MPLPLKASLSLVFLRDYTIKPHPGSFLSPTSSLIVKRTETIKELNNRLVSGPILEEHENNIFVINAYFFHFFASIHRVSYFVYDQH